MSNKMTELRAVCDLNVADFSPEFIKTINNTLPQLSHLTAV